MTWWESWLGGPMVKHLHDSLVELLYSPPIYAWITGQASCSFLLLSSLFIFALNLLTITWLCSRWVEYPNFHSTLTPWLPPWYALWSSLGYYSSRKDLSTSSSSLSSLIELDSCCLVLFLLVCLPVKLLMLRVGEEYLLLVPIKRSWTIILLMAWLGVISSSFFLHEEWWWSTCTPACEDLKWSSGHSFHPKFYPHLSHYFHS